MKEKLLLQEDLRDMELIEEIKKKQISKDLLRKKRYYDGDHWGELGESYSYNKHINIDDIYESLITTSGNRTLYTFFVGKKDRIKPSTVNILKNGIDKLSNFIQGESETLFRSTNDNENSFLGGKTNLNDVYKDIIKTGLIYGDVYLNVIENEGKFTFDVLKNKDIAIDEDEFGNIITIAYRLEEKRDKSNVGIMYDSKDEIFIVKTKKEIRIYTNNILISTNKNKMDFLNIFKIDCEEILNKDTRRMQDEVNIYETLLKYKVLGWISPIQYISGLSSADYLALKDNSALLGGLGTVNALPGIDSKITISQLNGLDDFALQKGKLIRRDLWNSLKLEGVTDNQDTGNLSGKALVLKQIDCKSYINTFRFDIIKGIKSTLDILNSSNIKKWSNVNIDEIKLNDTIWDILEEEKNLQQKIDNEDRKIDLLEKWAGYFMTLGENEKKAQELAQEKVDLLFN